VYVYVYVYIRVAKQSQKADGELDLYSEHAGCPVLNGTKWAGKETDLT
jgi:hypothetical protein